MPALVARASHVQPPLAEDIENNDVGGRGDRLAKGFAGSPAPMGFRESCFLAPGRRRAPGPFDGGAAARLIHRRCDRVLYWFASAVPSRLSQCTAADTQSCLDVGQVPPGALIGN